MRSPRSRGATHKPSVPQRARYQHLCVIASGIIGVTDKFPSPRQGTGKICKWTGKSRPPVRQLAVLSPDDGKWFDWASRDSNCDSPSCPNPAGAVHNLPVHPLFGVCLDYLLCRARRLCNQIVLPTITVQSTDSPDQARPRVERFSRPPGIIGITFP